MAQTKATEQQEAEIYSLCGKKNEEEMHEQQDQLLVKHDEAHTEPMENPKYPSESEDEENPKYPSESDGEKKKGGLNGNLPLCKGILERNEAEEKGCSLFIPFGKKNEEETNEQQIPPTDTHVNGDLDTVNPTVMVEPHLSDSEGKTNEELIAERNAYSASSNGEEVEEKEERKRKNGGSIKGIMKRRNVMNINTE